MAAKRRSSKSRKRKGGQASPRGRFAVAPGAAREQEVLARAIELHRAGDLERAEDSYRRLLAGNPRQPDATHLLGVIAHARGQFEVALDWVGRAIGLSPGEPLYHASRGLALMALHRWEEATDSFRESLRLSPKNPHTHNNLGLVLKSLGRWDEAIGHFREAIRNLPGFAEAYTNLGTVLLRKNRVEEAIAHHREALRLNPGIAEIHNNLGIALRAGGSHEEAAACYERAIRLRPDYPEAHLNLGSVCRDMGKTAEAGACFRKACEIRPTNGLRVRLATLLPVIHPSVEEMRKSREAFEAGVDRLLREGVKPADPFTEVGATNFYLVYQGANDKGLQRKFARLFHRAEEGEAPGSGSGDRLRVGFVSKHLRDHTIGKLMLGIVEELSREHFEVIVLSPARFDDPVAERFRESADRYIVLPEAPRPAADVIRDLKLDVLFYPDIGMEPFTYFLAFSRLAPVQCVTWGHPVTTGIETIDYFVSGEDLEAEGAEEHYTEALVRLSTVPACYHPIPVPDSFRPRSHYGLSDDAHIYLCPQSLFKFHPAFDEALGEILRRDPLGRLVLISGTHAHWNELLLDRFRRVIPDVAGRVTFVPRLKGDDYLGLLACADVALDTFYFSGGNTTVECLALGVPVVTLPGRYMCSRVSYAWSRKIGVVDGVASDPEEYVDIAVRLGTERPRREELRRKILSCRHRLFGDTTVVRELEAFFIEAVRKARPDRAGLPEPLAQGTAVA